MARNAGQTRLRILSAARNLFSSHGYPGTSLDDILTAAGITKGAFYHHFKSKEHICQVLLDEAVLDIQCMEGETDSEGDPYEQIRRWGESLIRPDDSGLRHHCRLVMRLTGDMALFSTPTPDKINRFWKELHITLTGLLRRLPSLNSSCSNPEEAAAIMLTVLTGALWMQQSTALPMDTESLMESCMRMIAAGPQGAGQSF